MLFDIIWTGLEKKNFFHSFSNHLFQNFISAGLKIVQWQKNARSYNFTVVVMLGVDRGLY